MVARPTGLALRKQVNIFIIMISIIKKTHKYCMEYSRSQKKILCFGLPYQCSSFWCLRPETQKTTASCFFA